MRSLSLSDYSVLVLFLCLNQCVVAMLHGCHVNAILLLAFIFCMFFAWLPYFNTTCRFTTYTTYRYLQQNTENIIAYNENKFGSTLFS